MKSKSTMTVLQLAEKIVNGTKDKWNDIPPSTKSYIKELSRRLGLTPTQAMLLSVFIDNSSDSRIDFRDIARHFNVRQITILSLMDDIEELIRRNVIKKRKDRDEEVCYRVPLRTIEYLRSGMLPEPEKTTNLSAEEFIDRIGKYLKQRYDEEIGDIELKRNINDLIGENGHLNMVKQIKNFGFCDDDLKMFLIMCVSYIRDNEDTVEPYDLRKYFDGLDQRMKDAGMRCGFTCLFYGAPGTGKTETALQLARETGRDIMTVDIPSIRSKWVGETEKNIKDVFNRYADLARDNGNAPILLFNEADAIFNRRAEGATDSVDKMENAMQNIILQEMERLEGILFATTNLTGSLDPAFDRRFLYKIEFEKPTPEASAKIWQSMMPELKDSDAARLSKSYPFSGGQIENIARKQLVNSILSDSDGLDLAKVEEACRQETLANNSTRRIGF